MRKRAGLRRHPSELPSCVTPVPPAPNPGATSLRPRLCLVVCRGALPPGLQLRDRDNTHEAQVKGLWPQVVSRAREGHAEDGYPLPLTDWGEQLQLAVHLHHGLPGSRAYVCPEPEGNRPGVGRLRSHRKLHQNPWNVASGRKLLP